MKNYKKPTVEIYVLAGNETICGGCGEKLSENTDLNTFLGLDYGDGDGVLTKAESENLFGLGESCSTEINGYCKFTSTGISNLSWS